MALAVGLAIGWVLCLLFGPLSHRVPSARALPTRSLHLPTLAASDESVPDLEIVTSHYHEDLRWLNVSRYRPVVCQKPGSDPLPFGWEPDPFCSLHINKGQEGSAFLAYIVSRYETLPKRVAFLHGHEHAGHQHHPLKNLLRVIETARPDQAFVSLNNKWHVLVDKREDLPKGTPSPTKAYVRVPPWLFFKELWTMLIGPMTGLPVPPYVRQEHGAQFLVHRELILSRPKHLYQALLDYLLFHPLTRYWTDRWGAIAVEISWPLIWGESYDICNDLPACTYEANVERKFDLGKNFTRVLKTPREMALPP